MLALLVYLLLGLALAVRFLPSLRGAVRCWLGLVTGCAALMWLPCAAAFFWGFSKAAEDNALGLSIAVILAIAAEYILRRRDRLRTWRENRFRLPTLSRRDLAGLLLSLFATLFCAYLLYTHVILPREGDGLWVGQSTYGDLAMHLGFVESLYQQGTFPPEYSILPGQQLNYPFLVDAASASLRFYGLSLRMSVILPSVIMLFCVFWGFWLLADKITGRLAPSVMSWLLFAGNGGFGFLYFFGKYDFSEIFTGFYTTPTNLVDQDIRWVNVICDMLIPQRTTMAGWCVLLGAVFLLISAMEKLLAGKKCRRELVFLAVLAGALPMIHTHSFLALGILSAAWFFSALPRAKRKGRIGMLVRGYVLYGAICLLLAAPQFFKWTMDSVESGNLLRWHLGWVAGANGALTNWFVFFAVNVGVVFIAMWPMLFFLRGKKLRLFLGGAAIFLIANVVTFQPNLYDNNKLLYVWFMLTDILVCDWICGLLRRIRPRAVRAALAGLLVFLGMFSGVLSLLREAVSEYQLLSQEQVDAADFIVENTEPDAVFLTASDHRNAVAVLTGRNIVCGPGLYLYYHGVNYQERENQLPLLYAGGDGFAPQAEELDIDYVYIGATEYASYAVDYDFFRQNYPLIYEAEGISIFQISEES